MLKALKICVAAVALLASPGIAHAASDPLDDFLSTYTGAQTPDLDILSATASFDGTAFHLSATMDGAIGGSVGSLYVFGINRGAGTPRLNFISTPPLDPTVLWDSLAVMLPDGTLRVVTFPAMGAPTITPIADGVSVDGATISASVPLDLLTSRGFAAEDYIFQMWTRLRVNPMADGFNSEVADFGPRLVASVPEPASWAMLIAGFGLTGAAVRRRRPAFAARSAIA